jgi:hypothetical protein
MLTFLKWTVVVLLGLSLLIGVTSTLLLLREQRKVKEYLPLSQSLYSLYQGTKACGTWHSVLNESSPVLPNGERVTESDREKVLRAWLLYSPEFRAEFNEFYLRECSPSPVASPSPVG